MYFAFSRKCVLYQPSNKNSFYDTREFNCSKYLLKVYNKFLAHLGAAQKVKILELDWLDALIYAMRMLLTRSEKAWCELNLAHIH